MNNVTGFIRRNQTTFWMFTFVLLFYSFVVFMNRTPQKNPENSGGKKIERFSREDLRQKEETFKENIKGHPRLMGLIWLAMLLTLAAGIGIDICLLGRKLNKLPLMESAAPPAVVGWGLREVLQIFVFLFFLETVIILVEMTAASLVNMKRWNSDVWLMANSLVRNLGAVILILIWTRRRFRASFAAIGLVTKNFWKNVRRGILGYLAMIPVLFGALLMMSFLAQLFSYEPLPQEVVQIYLKASSSNALLFFTLFVALIGPAIEEIFFRGFTYTALRDRWGVRWAMILSAALFSLMHMNLIAFIPVFFLGVFLAYLYEKTGSLVPSMTVHMAHNFMMVNAALFFKGMAS